MTAGTSVFLFGTLATDGALDAFGLAKGVPARAEKIGVVPGWGTPYEGIGPSDEDLDGLLVTVDARTFAKMQWFANVLGHAQWEIEAAGKTAVIFGWGAQAGEDKDWADLGERALPELLAYYPDVHGARMRALAKIVLARTQTRMRALSQPSVSGIRQGPGREKVREGALEQPHRGFFHLDDVTLTHPRFDGGSATVRRETFVGCDATLVLPYDPIADRVVLIEQFRVGPYRRGDRQPWMLEPIAGLIDPGETAATTAFREAEEEAGITLGKLVAMPGGYPSPGATAEFFHMFIGLADLQAYEPRAAGLASEGEDILSHVLSLDEALGLLETGEAAVVPLALMLTWTALHRDRLHSIEVQRRQA